MGDGREVRELLEWIVDCIDHIVGTHPILVNVREPAKGATVGELPTHSIAGVQTARRSPARARHARRRFDGRFGTGTVDTAARTHKSF
ncbi:hypothetical protein C446_16882 [Halobiforma nitratireducens JCM 10879]|uniref:Uncharacterized protein n=1 Tax=Halobiforma nitratireducens JCM 10879 TaxID=1227454 RepID=M0L900_9EURY|nr:hypothetical protein C446_16882 [Halobiforma nitratireducens JCM 10879]